ncbi:HAD family hydrolase [Paenibacillus sp. GSMTC-2017]|uniref:HAD family hydrolase n=1 Tax=Paenibacillus sp. GSMTC-2017 TaxID=2794350 RepID=UPI0018D93ABE|nr:HAD-IA family hydrolase [Paenibacillus sp. GSMTC-2017]MBH5319735.1 HAD family hydrolase [Paenibacillus sp. GSMTC-2017]
MPDLVINDNRYPVKGILFDKDGTLLDFIRLWGYWSESVHRHFSSLVPSAVAPLSELWGTIHDDDGRVNDYSIEGPLAMGSTGDLQAILAWQAYRLGTPWGDAMKLARESMNAAYVEMETTRPAVPLPGMLDFVKLCSTQGLALGVVTADETREAENHLTWLGIRSHFKAVIGHDMVKRGKPYPDMVELACFQLGLHPAEVAVIGDTNGDMQMGNSAKVAVTVGLSDITMKSAHKLIDADEVVSSYAQLRLEASDKES